jgi:alkylation response protein AidB-like acyl-CoA dehydrogenase
VSTTTDPAAVDTMSEEERAWRATARAWLLENTDPIETDTGFATMHWMITPDQEAEHHRRCGEMHRRLHAAGYTAITVPKEYGGQGGEPWMQRAFAEEAADRDINTGFYGSIIGMAAPALLYFGTEEQKQTHLRGLVSGEVSWCQLFSEPGAGSDLAGLGARAERDGEEFVINGQKVWNSAAMYADMGILLVRTDPDAVKHAGITFLLFDMRQPGVEVRRLVQANGAGHFAEVFLSDARCRVADVLGDIDGGWAPTRLVMANESAVIGGAGGDRAGKLVQLARMVGRAQDRVIRQRLADVYTRQLLLGRMSAEIAAAARERRPMPIDPSVVKLYVAESRRREGDLAQELLGPAGVAVAHEASEWAMEALVSRYPISIGGGTDEVHHNNLGERALGLPRDVRVDRDVPWKDVPRG